MDDTIYRQDAIDALDVLCQEHRYKIPGKVETYSQYNEAWQDALDRAEGAIGNLPPAQPEIIRCKDCEWWEKQKDSAQGRCDLMQMYPTGGWYCGNAQRRVTDGGLD